MDNTTHLVAREQVQADARRQPCPQRDKPWVLVAAILGSSLAFIEGSVVNLALPSIQSDFSTASSGVQWVLNAYLLVLGAFMLVGGSLGDRYGLRRIFVLGTAIFGAGAAACALAPALSWLIAARLVQGLGGALLVPASLALIGSHFEDEERGRAIGTWAGASALTTAIGPVLGGWLVDQWGWQSVFVMVAPLAAATVAIAVWRVPVTHPVRDERPDYAGALLLAGALALLIFALVDAGPAWRRIAAALAALLAGGMFLHRERRCRHPMLPLALFRSRSFSGANLMTLLLYFALTGALFFLPFNLIQVQGWSATAAGAAFLPFTVIMGFGSTFAGGMLRKFDPRHMLTIGPLVTAAGFFALAVPGTDAAFVTGFLPGIVIIGIGMTLSVAPLTTVVMSSVGDGQAGLASGVNNTAARLA
ncbi:MAG TPA: MFS transporter, partial [Gammaproteobacteria bacterium]